MVQDTSGKVAERQGQSLPLLNNVLQPSVTDYVLVEQSMKELGIWNFHYCFEGCEGWALYLLTKVLGWSIDECRVLVAKFRNALKDNKTHAYYLV